MCSHVASQHPLFPTLCGLGSCFCKTMKTPFISCSPSTVLPQPLYVAAQCPMPLDFPGGGHGGGWGHLLPLGCGCWFAGALSLATASDPEPANSGGKGEVNNGPGLLVEEGKEANCCGFPMAQCFTRVSPGREDAVSLSSKGAVLGRRDSERRHPTG